MKKILLFMLLLGVFGGVNTFALSCTEILDFDQMYERAVHAIEAEVVSVEYIPGSEKDEQYCTDVGQHDVAIGSYHFTLEVTKTYKGDFNGTVELEREVDSIYCLWGNACNAMQIGETYVLVSDDGETLQGGLCSVCPYVLAADFIEPEPETCICTMEYNPVCGSDGVTYGNPCQAGCAGIDALVPGECEEELCICTREYMPVCGVDGVTYGNLCEAGCGDVDIAYEGECSDLGPIVDPYYCTQRYDGCNDCMVEERRITACTERACIHQDRAKCIGFDFTYLTDSQYEKVERAVNNWRLSASSETLQAMIDRVDTRISEIDNILATTRFAENSPVYYRYLLLLEALRAINGFL